jgi:hypothetical protein
VHLREVIEGVDVGRIGIKASGERRVICRIRVSQNRAIKIKNMRHIISDAHSKVISDL